jgi:Cu2+-exporting ATPase
VWLADFNIFAIPLAAGVLAARGVLLIPRWGAVLISASIVAATVNASSLKRANL